MMLPTLWINSLTRNLFRSQKDDRFVLPRTCLVGVGSDLRGDDSAGLVVVRKLLKQTHAENLLIVEGGPAPENVTGKLRAFHPDLVILIDAAQMDEPPGTIQLIPLESIDGMSASSHSLPLSMLANYLTVEIGCEVCVLGIQPAQNEIGAELSPSVQTAVDEITKELRNLFSISM
ncbi:MAG: hydrogenase 3 maturation endopeptidase HyCI [Anaerolineales bacterium]|nr:hydrogenase 3 maturation endopeptidase HyCI [Anaerolineales bacterium]